MKTRRLLCLVILAAALTSCTTDDPLRREREDFPPCVSFATAPDGIYTTRQGFAWKDNGLVWTFAY